MQYSYWLNWRNSAFPFNRRSPSPPPHRDNNTAPVSGSNTHRRQSGAQWKIKDFRLQHRQRHFRAYRRHQAGNQPQQGKLRPQRSAQQRFSCPQRAPDHQLLMALTHTDLHLRQQQQHAAGRHQPTITSSARLTSESTADLTQDGADIQQTDGGKLAVQLGQHRGTVIPAEAGEPALRLPVQRPGGENKEEVWPQALPVYFAHAADLRAELPGYRR